MWPGAEIARLALGFRDSTINDFFLKALLDMGWQR